MLTDHRKEPMTDMQVRLDTVKTHLMAHDGWTCSDIDTINTVKRLLASRRPGRHYYRLLHQPWCHRYGGIRTTIGDGYTIGYCTCHPTEST